MAANDLNKPLLRQRRRRFAAKRRPVFAPALISLAVLVALVGALWLSLVDDPDGGQPVAMATIQDAPITTGSLAQSASQPGAETELAATVPAPNIELAALPAAAAMPDVLAGDPALLEPSGYGPLPRVSPDGRRARDVYARHAPAAVAGAPRIAIVVGGMGLSQTGTQRAIETLPEDITLAFAPYGSSLMRWVQKARDEGHEVLLQVPLEPLRYPEENPGEHTLLVSMDRRANQENLNWVLGRMTSYAGVMNYMGERFTGEDGALVPFLGEIGRRGLFYLDDGSSPRSRAAVLGKALQVPVITADAIVDLGRSPGEISRRLEVLESTARSRGTAVGVASAFPGSVEAIAAWSRDAPTRGIVLVPASAVQGR